MAIDSQKIPASAKFLSASLAGVAATLVCYPLDVLKLNMQVAGEGGVKSEQTNTIEFAKHIVKHHGVPGLYAGLTCSIVRQFLYTGGRLGLFQTLVDYYTVNGEPPGVLVKSICGAISGAFGGMIGLPPDVALTRMAVDPRLPMEKRRNYKNVIDAMLRIKREEGATALARGLNVTVLRAMVVNVSQFVSYIQFKEFLLRRNWMKDDTSCHLVCSGFSSVVATICVLPPDMAKTRIQNMKIINGVPEYKNMFDVWFKVIRNEGFFSLWKGFTPLLLRNAPQFVVVFVVYEQLISIFRKMF